MSVQGVSEGPGVGNFPLENKAGVTNRMPWAVASRVPPPAKKKTAKVGNSFGQVGATGDETSPDKLLLHFCRLLFKKQNGCSCAFTRFHVSRSCTGKASLEYSRNPPPPPPWRRNPTRNLRRRYVLALLARLHARTRYSS